MQKLENFMGKVVGGSGGSSHKTRLEFMQEKSFSWAFLSMQFFFLVEGRDLTVRYKVRYFFRQPRFYIVEKNFKHVGQRYECSL